MRRLILITVAWMFAVLSFAQEQREYLIQMEYSSKKEIQKITRLVSIDDVKGNTIIAYASPQQLETLREYGLSYDIIPKPEVDPKSLTMATTIEEMADWDRYPTYDVYVEMMYQFAQDHPDICRIESIGNSVENREILALKITDNPDVNEVEPEFYYTGQMHGDEIVAYILFLRLADYLLDNYGTDPRVTNLVNNVEIWINPLSNPDGTYAGGDNTVSSATRYNANSYDLNRNFPSPEYENPSGMNQPEIQCQIAFAEEHTFVMSANSHSGIELVNYPWDTWYSDENPHADHDWFNTISYHYADTVHAYAPSDYFTGQGDGVTHGADWYVALGTRQDHMNYFQNCREVTIELSDVKLLDSDELPDHWEYNRRSFLGYIEECLTGFQGIVTSTNEEPLNAKIKIVSHDQDNSWVKTDPENGDYYRPVQPGTYDVTFSANGYIPQTIEGVAVVSGTPTEINVVLQQAQVVSVTGTVTDQTTGGPIEGAAIELLDTQIDPVVTNANGEFTIDDVFEDNYNIRIYKEGFAGITESISVTAENNYFTFALSPVNAISFEGGVLPSEFTTSGDANWFVTGQDAFDGVFSVQSGDISDNQSTELSFVYEFNQASEISFAYKVSSEEDYDELKFYIDGNEQDVWSGQFDWDEATYPVSEGEHTFTWKYEKDVSVSSGADAAWVDFIVLPSQDPLPGMAELSADAVDLYIGAAGELLTADISITNVGDSILSYTTVMQNGEWCSITTTPVDLGADESATISFVADPDGLTNGEYNDVLIVSADQTFNIPITLTISDFGTVTFTVQDENSNVIEGAQITIDGGDYLTNSSGIAQIILNDGEYDYQVSAYGFGTASDTITIAGDDVNEVVTLPEISYSVVFTVKNPDGGIIENASIGINGEELTTNAQGEASIELGNGSYDYDVAADGYNNANGSITVDGSNVNKNVTLTYELFTATFTVSCNDVVLEGAQIQINDETLYTNSQGVANIELANGSYNYVVALNGYENAEGVVEINNEDIEVLVTLSEQLYVATFTVSGTVGLVEGAQIHINEDTLYTDGDGVASIELSNGQYDYVVSSDGYENVDGDVEIDGQNVDVQVSLTDIVSLSHNDLSIYPNPAQNKVTVKYPAQFEVGLYNPIGDLLISRSCSGKEVLNVEQFTPGLYLIKVKAEGLLFTKQIIIE